MYSLFIVKKNSGKRQNKTTEKTRQGNRTDT